MLVSLTVGKVDAGVTVLLTPDKRLIEFPSILLPPDISSGSIVDITVARNLTSEATAEQRFQTLQEQIFKSFGTASPTTPILRCRNATQTSVVLEWDPIQLATADLISLALYRNGQKAGNIPRPLQMHTTKISGLAVDTKYTFHLVLRTTAGTMTSERVEVQTHKMTDLSGITITTGILPQSTRENLAAAVERIGAKIVDSVRIDTTHFVTTEGRGIQWEKAVEMNIPVVRPEWVEACEKNGRILGVTKFYLDALRPGPPSEDRPGTAGTITQQQQQQQQQQQYQQPQQQQQQQQSPPAPAAAPVPVENEKELPPPPAENGEESSSKEKESESESEKPEAEVEAETEAEENGAQSKEEAVEEGDKEESEEDDEPERKTEAAEQEEDKARSEDKEQNLTLRQVGSKSFGLEDSDDKDLGAPSPVSRSSFQEVQL
ncbi:Chitin biosynthesis protein CHS5 [Cytospora mali]|uniref:Chitin biosynthesis protein CHS5 n=1 Tax=Cytospora mali TaxID=578113 RepID=A0A194V113_CYTMA|nr:Chitin biosynthesis protein CHS5 [Valsa mali var. pyri (nom. inval.)]